MPKSSGRSTSQSLARELGKAYHTALGDVDMTFRATRQRAAVARQIEAEPAPSRGLHAAGMAVALVALLAVGLMGWRAQRTPSSPATPTIAAVAVKTAEVAGPSVQPEQKANPGAWIQAPAKHAVDLSLGPSASGTLAAGGAARTRPHAPLGAEVWLESGAVHLEIEPNTGGEWTVYAGPYRVDVVGTEFSVSWDGPGSTLAVEVTRGEVRVSGGTLSSRGLGVVGGQRVEVTADGREARVLRADGQGEDVSDARRARVPKRHAAASTSAPKSTPKDAQQAWTTLFAKGQYSRAYEAARDVGFEDLLRTSNAKTLHDLADVARLHRDHQLAERTLKIVRTRFPGSREAARAAFELGRIAEDQRHSSTAARRWFERYLEEQPTGTWARDARGRILRSLARENPESARAAAAAYLRHHKDGPDASTARGILAQ